MRTSYERRRLLARHLVGDGLEIGPGHIPFPLLEHGVSVRYVDRWDSGDNRALFPELDDNAEFPQPDIVADLDQDRLSMVDDASQEFVIASHVLEHLANPIAMLRDIWRVLKPHGVCVVLLPDRTKTFDRTREPTSLDHLVEEYRSDVRYVDDDHIAEFLQGLAVPLAPAGERAAQFDLHRHRSIHVHCWAPDEFADVIHFTITNVGAPWIAVDGFTSGNGNEFGLVLVKGATSMSVTETAARFDETWRLLSSATAPPSFVDAAKSAVRATRVFPVLAKLRARALGRDGT